MWVISLSLGEIGWGQPYHLEKISGGLFHKTQIVFEIRSRISFSRGKSFVNPIVELAPFDQRPAHRSIFFLPPLKSLFYFIYPQVKSLTASPFRVCVDTHTNRDDLNAITPRKKTSPLREPLLCATSLSPPFIFTIHPHHPNENKTKKFKSTLKGITKKLVDDVWEQSTKWGIQRWAIWKRKRVSYQEKKAMVNTTDFVGKKKSFISFF